MCLCVCEQHPNRISFKKCRLPTLFWCHTQRQKVINKYSIVSISFKQFYLIFLPFELFIACLNSSPNEKKHTNDESQMSLLIIIFRDSRSYCIRCHSGKHATQFSTTLRKSTHFTLLLRLLTECIIV